MIKITCVVNWIVVREGRVVSICLVLAKLYSKQCQDILSYARMQWLTIISVVPYHALHDSEHVVASPFGPFSLSNDFLRISCRSKLYITGTGKPRYAGFCLELPTPRWIADHGLSAPSPLDIATKIQMTEIQKQ